MIKAGEDPVKVAAIQIPLEKRKERISNGSSDKKDNLKYSGNEG